ncbi:MAG: hypothetical protein J6U31_06125 [Bacteroidales bacterium]|nr:hypothetical protein [Bacteroidales bacterium]
MGRINYSQLILDRKGIEHAVKLWTSTPQADVTFDLRNWDVELLPVSYDFVNSRNFKPLAENGLSTDMQITPSPTRMPAPATQYEKAGYYKATFEVKQVGDIYLDLSTWGKGLIWVNGHCLGRFWNVGPQQTLYMPGCWLKKGRNEVIVMDVTGPDKAVMRGVKEPVLDVLHRDRMPQEALTLPSRSQRKAASAQQNNSNFVGNDAAPGAK